MSSFLIRPYVYFPRAEVIAITEKCENLKKFDYYDKKQSIKKINEKILEVLNVEEDHQVDIHQIQANLRDFIRAAEKYEKKHYFISGKSQLVSCFLSLKPSISSLIQKIERFITDAQRAQRSLEIIKAYNAPKEYGRVFKPVLRKEGKPLSEIFIVLFKRKEKEENQLILREIEPLIKKMIKIKSALEELKKSRGVVADLKREELKEERKTIYHSLRIYFDKLKQISNVSFSSFIDYYLDDSRKTYLRKYRWLSYPLSRATEKEEQELEGQSTSIEIRKKAISILRKMTNQEIIEFNLGSRSMRGAFVEQGFHVFNEARKQNWQGQEPNLQMDASRLDAIVHVFFLIQTASRSRLNLLQLQHSQRVESMSLTLEEEKNALWLDLNKNLYGTDFLFSPRDSEYPEVDQLTPKHSFVTPRKSFMSTVTSEEVPIDLCFGTDPDLADKVLEQVNTYVGALQQIEKAQTSFCEEESFKELVTSCELTRKLKDISMLSKEQIANLNQL